MADNQNTENIQDQISFAEKLKAKIIESNKIQKEGMDAFNTAWNVTSKLVDDYGKKIESNKLIHEDESDLAKQQLKDTEALIKALGTKSKMNKADTTSALANLKIKAEEYKLEIQNLKVQDTLKAKADGMLDGLESKIKNIPLVGDILASTFDFGGMKKQLGGIVGGITKNFMSLTAGGMSTGAALKASFGAALPLLKSFGRMLLASLGPIMLVVGALYLIKKAFDFNKETTQLAKDLGVSVDEARDMEKSFNSMSGSSSNLNVNTKSLVEAQKQLSSATGLTAEFSEQMLTDQIQLTKFMGLSGDEAANFQKIATGNNQTAREMQGEIAGSVEQFNNATGASVSLKDVVQDIAKLPTDIRVGFKGTTAELARTVAMAKVMGTTLEESVAAGKATLDIESSLKNEAKARMLTGISINNNAIRAAQLGGDQAEVLRLQKEELGKIDNFNEMAPYQQEALAAAMGMTVDQVVKQKDAMALSAKAGIDLSTATLEQVKNAKGLSKEEKDKLIRSKEQVAAQEKLSELGAKFGDLINSIVAGPLGEMVGIFVDILVPAVKGLMFVFGLIMTPIKLVLGGLAAMASYLVSIKDTIAVFLTTFGLFYAIQKRSLIVTEAKALWDKRAVVMSKIELGLEFAKNAARIIGNGIIAAANLIKKKGLLTAIAEMAMKAFTSLSAIPVIGPVLGIAAAAGAVALGYSYYSKADDMVAPSGYGDKVLTGPEGSIALNNKDSVIAGTNLFGNEGSGNQDSGNNQMGAIFQQLVSEVRGLRSDIQAQPIMITVDGKVVSQITKVQNKQSSFRK